MSCYWLNIRFLLWHLQMFKGDLFRPIVTFNPWWWQKSLLWKPVGFYDCDLRAAWKHRGETCWKPSTWGQKPVDTRQL